MKTITAPSWRRLAKGTDVPAPSRTPKARVKRPVRMQPTCCSPLAIQTCATQAAALPEVVHPLGPAHQAMVRGNLGKQSHDAGWGQCFQILSSKAKWAGQRVIAVDPRFTSQRCRVCSHTKKGNRASQANFRGLSCGHTENADVNAAKNISAQGGCLVTQRLSTETVCREKTRPASALTALKGLAQLT